ncbi:MAG: RES family NAD+ phosphorylase [Bacteroidota bacterium]
MPTDWQEFPHPASTQDIGRDFVTENEYCVLIIPSVVTPGDYNVLINPNHTDFSKITTTSVDKFPFDKRIFK